jgi:hypothetical protein
MIGDPLSQVKFLDSGLAGRSVWLATNLRRENHLYGAIHGKRPQTQKIRLNPDPIRNRLGGTVATQIRYQISKTLIPTLEQATKFLSQWYVKWSRSGK